MIPSVPAASTFNEPRLRRLFDAWALALTAFSLLLQGHRFGVGIQEILIAQVRHSLDPGWLAGDWIVAGQVHHPLVTAALALLVRALGEPGGFLLAHAATRLLLLCGVHRLCSALVPSARWAPLLAMLMVVFEPRLRIGSHFLQGGHFEVAFLGMAVAVWGLAAAVRWIHDEAPWWQPAVALGLGVLVHLFIGLPVLAVVMMTWLISRRHNLRSSLGPCGAVLAVALVVSAPSWLPAAKAFLFPGPQPLSPSLLIALLQARHPHHHMPWTWPPGDLVLGLIVLVAVYHALHRCSPRMLLPWVLLGWYVISGLVFVLCVWFLLLPVVAYFQAFRLLGLLLAVGACGAAAVIESRLLDGRHRGGARLWRLACALAMCVLFRVPLLFLPALLAISFLPAGSDESEAAPPAAIRRGWFPVTVLCLLGVLLLQFSPPVRELANGLHREHWLANVAPREADRRELADWVHANTSPGDVFLIPPDLHGFRIVEERPVVADWIHVPFENKPLWEWGRRHLAQSSLPEAVSAPLGETPTAADAAAVLAWRQQATLPLPLAPIARRLENGRRFGAVWVIHPAPVRGDAVEAAFVNERFAVFRVP